MQLYLCSTRNFNYDNKISDDTEKSHVRFKIDASVYSG